MPDRIEETLAALRTDVDHLPVADSGSVRRRGQQRTRNQVLGSAFATVAVVAAAVGIGGGLLGGERTSAPPATDPPTATTASPEPTTVDPPVTEVPGSVLLTADELGLARLSQENVNAAGIETLTSGCLLGSDDVVEFGFAAFGPSADGEPVLSQSVITQREAEDAQRQLAGFRADFEACEERRAQVPDSPETTVASGELSPAQQGRVAALGEGAWVYQVTTPEATSLVVGLRTANVSAVLAADTAEYSADELLDLATDVRSRMTEVYGG
jgi:hypothetical protein